MSHFIEGATAHYHGPNFIILNTPKSTNRWQDFLFLDNVFESWVLKGKGEEHLFFFRFWENLLFFKKKYDDYGVNVFKNKLNMFDVLWLLITMLYFL